MTHEDDSISELDDNELEASAADSGDADGGSGAGLEQLQLALDAAKAEIDKLRNEALRARADADNVRKRAERDVENAHKYGIERFVSELLPVKDSLDLGCEAARSASDTETILEGMELTLKMFTSALEKLGLTVVDPVEEPFNPEYHEAMAMQPSTEFPPGTVLQVMQKGYLLNDRLIRPAMVMVSKEAPDAGGA